MKGICLQSKVAMTPTPGCVKQWSLGAQFVASLSYHLDDTKFIFMPILGIF